MRTRTHRHPRASTARSLGSARSLGFAALGLLGLGCHDGGGSNAVADRLLTCDLVSQGKLQARSPDSVRAACFQTCEARATCSELSALYCDDQKSAALRDCERTCAEPASCRDGRGSYTISQACDGRSQCDDGTDELGCPEPFYCESSGARIQTYQRCNGVIDCTDGSDEEGCSGSQALFACQTRARGLAQYIPYDRVCDLVKDCADGSDEGAAQGCAVLRCP